MMYLIVALLCASQPALAGDVSFAWQSRLLDSTGVPLNGVTPVSLALYGAETGGSELWSTTYTDANIQGGYLSLILQGEDDDGDELDDLAFGTPLWIEVRVSGVAMTPRQALGMVPRAANAGIGSGTGLSVDSAATSCQTLKDAGDTTGWRWVDPNGGSPHDAHQVYCEQSLESGGWNVCAGFDPSPDEQRAGRVPADIFTNRYGHGPSRDGEDDRYWAADCAALGAALGATEVLLRTTKTGEYWRLQAPANLADFAFRGNVNQGTLDDTTVVLSTNSSWGNGTVRVNWSGDCGWGTCAHQWHILENSAVSCNADRSGGGGINIPATPNCQTSVYSLSCGVGTSADSASECDNQWIYMGVR